jgi:hypothetical protein
MTKTHGAGHSFPPASRGGFGIPSFPSLEGTTEAPRVGMPAGDPDVPGPDRRAPWVDSSLPRQEPVGPPVRG